MNKKIKTLIYIVAALGLAMIIILPKLESSDNKAAGNPSARNAAINVRAHIVQPEILHNKISSSGTVIANEEVELKSETSGKITKIAFREGSPVNKGALLVKINDAELQAQLTSANYRLELLNDKEFRAKKLLEKQAISNEEYDVALNELNTQKANIEFIQAQIAKTEIRAPFNGVIGLKNVSEGSFINTTTVIAKLQNLNPVKIDFAIPEKYSGMIKTGDEISFKVEGMEQTFIGKIYAIEPKIDPVTRTLQLRALSSNPGNKILPGSFADVSVILQDIKDAFMIPSNALIPELKGQKVYLYKNGNAVPVQVETGIRTDERIQVTSGITAGDTLITSGILQIRPNSTVSISNID